MARKKTNTLAEQAKVFKQIKGDDGSVNKPVEQSPSTKIRQDIANLCTSIGDRSFVIRQANSDITAYYAQIDQLRDQLRILEVPANGPEATK